MPNDKNIDPGRINNSLNVIETTLEDMEQEYDDVSEVESALKHKVQLLKLAKSNFEKCLEYEEAGDTGTAWNHLTTGIEHLQEAGEMIETEEKDLQEISELEKKEEHLKSRALDALLHHIDPSSLPKPE
jgi:prefoldin subunit 5